MTATPGRPEDWADTNPESTTPERILLTPEGVTPSATKVAMVCYAVGAASMCWEHPERAGVFDSDRASQIVTELCVALGVEQQGGVAPESARPATLTPEQPVKAPGQDGDIFLTRGTPVEADWPTGSRLLHYVDEGGYQLTAEDVGNGSPYSWGGARIVRVFTEDKPADTDTEGAVYLSGPMTGLPDFNRPAFHAAAAALREQGHVVINPAEVDLGPDATWADYMRIHLAEIARRVTQVFVLPGWESSRGAQLEVHVARALGLPVVPVFTEDKPAQEPALPRRIEPEDVRVGMVVERRKDECYVGGRVKSIDGSCIGVGASVVAWTFGGIFGYYGWTLWLVEDAPEPEDPDAELVERMAKEVHDRNCADVGCRDWDGHGESTRKAWRDDARVVLRNLRAQGFDVTRAEQ